MDSGAKDEDAMSSDKTTDTDTPAEASEVAPAPRGPLVTTLTPISEQIGQHVMAAFQQPGAVAVLTTVVPGVDADRVVSLALTDEQMDGVRVILDEIQAEDEVAAEDTERCIGFQCKVHR
jgi:hypothetical protein